MINQFHFSKHTLPFQNVVLFLDVRSFSKCSSFWKCAFIFNEINMWKWCERFCEVFFHLSEKHNCKQKSADFTKICTVTKNSFWWGGENHEIYKALEFVSVVGNLQFITSRKKRMFTSSYNLFLKLVMLSKCIEVYVVSISRLPSAFDGLQEHRFGLWRKAIWVL